MRPEIPNYEIGINPMRNCTRCGAEVHMSAENQPHLCADIAKRLARREKQIAAVVEILGPGELPFGRDINTVAEIIVKKLSEMGVTDD